MAYQSWSVVFGEQPSAAKWNILGTNDAAFNDGSGFADGAISGQAIGLGYQFADYSATPSASQTEADVTGATVTVNVPGDGTLMVANAGITELTAASSTDMTFQLELDLDGGIVTIGGSNEVAGTRVRSADRLEVSTGFFLPVAVTGSGNKTVKLVYTTNANITGGDMSGRLSAFFVDS